MTSISLSLITIHSLFPPQIKDSTEELLETSLVLFSINNCLLDKFKALFLKLTTPLSESNVILLEAVTDWYMSNVESAFELYSCTASFKFVNLLPSTNKLLGSIAVSKSNCSKRNFTLKLKG